VRTLRPGGVLVPVPEGLDEPPARAAAEVGVPAVDFLVEPDHAGLAELSALVDAGRLAVTVPPRTRWPRRRGHTSTARRAVPGARSCSPSTDRHAGSRDGW
jgi:hypothetical protein